MQTELNVSLLRGRRILDHRAMRSGMALRVSLDRAVGFEAVPEGEASEGDVVVDFRAGEPYVRLPMGAAGKLGLAGTQRDVVAGEVELPSGARGWIGLGDATLLIQAGPAPRVGPRRRLPPEARSLIARAERPLLVVLAGTLVLELLFVNAVRRRPGLPVEAEPEEFAAPAQPLRVVPRPTPPPREVAAPTTPTSKPSTRPTGRPAQPQARADAGAPPRAALLEALASLNKNPVFSSGNLPFDFDTLRGRPIVDVDTTVRGRPSREIEVQTIGLPGVGDPGPRPVLVEHPTPRPRLVIEPAPTPEPGQDPDDVQAVARQIKLRKGEIQGCYESSLKRNAGLAGRMVIQFEVGQDGAIEEVSYPAEQLAGDSVQQCITLRARAWKLRPLKQHEGLSVAFPFVFAAAE